MHLTLEIQVKLSEENRLRKDCLPATNESSENNSYLEEELESNNSNDLLPVTQSETNPHHTKLLEGEMYKLREKINTREVGNKILKVEYEKQMKNECLYNYENISKNRNHL